LPPLRLGLAQINTTEGRVLLSDEAIVVSFGFAQDRFVVRSAAGELDTAAFLSPECLHVVIEEP